MTQDEVGFMEWAFKAVMAGIIALGVYLWSNLVSIVKTLKHDLERTEKDLSDHKLKISENYTTKNDFNISLAQINETVKRTHERIDGIYEILNKP